MQPRLKTAVSTSLVLAMLACSQGAWATRFAPTLEPTVEPAEEAFTRVESLSPTLIQADESDAPTFTLRSSVQVERPVETPQFTLGSLETLGKGEKLTLVMMDMMATGFNKPGDNFHARVKEAVVRNGKVLIPGGTLIAGHVAQNLDPGSALSKRGKMILALDYLLMPDGRKIPLQSQYAKGDSALAATGRAMGNGVVGTVGGAVQGVMAGFRLGGLLGASASNGATLIGGGALGALVGLGNGLSKGGDGILVNEGDVVQVALEAPLQLPELIRGEDIQNEVQAPGLNVQVTDYKLGRDPFRVENQITLGLKVDNQTDYTFGSLDIALMDEYDNKFAVSPFGESSTLIVRVNPGSADTMKLSFSVKAPEVRHYLVFYRPYTREILAKISLTEALNTLQAKKSSDKISHRS